MEIVRTEYIAEWHEDSTGTKSINSSTWDELIEKLGVHTNDAHISLWEWYDEHRFVVTRLNGRGYGEYIECNNVW